MKTRQASRWGIAAISLGLLLITGVTVLVFVSDCDDDEHADQPNATTQQR